MAGLCRAPDRRRVWFLSSLIFVFPSEFSQAGGWAAERASPALSVVNMSVWLGTPYLLALESNYYSVRAK